MAHVISLQRMPAYLNCCDTQKGVLNEEHLVVDLCSIPKKCLHECTEVGDHIFEFRISCSWGADCTIFLAIMSLLCLVIVVVASSSSQSLLFLIRSPLIGQHDSGDIPRSAVDALAWMLLW